MGPKKTNNNEQGIANFAALKTAIANSEEPLVKELVGNQTMLDIEKSYLIDLAKLNSNLTIINLLKNIRTQQ
ncbi:MAG: hypothetical protein ACJA0G_000535 [Kangiellaceae bacterium]|jgi:hypothetical protein